VSFDSSYERADIAVPSLSRPPSVLSDGLSWDSSGLHSRLALLRIACAPVTSPSTSSLGVHSRSVATASVWKLPPPDLVRLRGFSPPCRFSPPITRSCSWLCDSSAAAGLTGLLHPAADPGVRCVSLARRVSADPTGDWFPNRQPPVTSTPSSSHRVSYPPEDSPPLQLVPRFRGRCPLGLRGFVSLDPPDAPVASCAVLVSENEVVSLRALLRR